jgi:hypothetical protein
MRFYRVARKDRWTIDKPKRYGSKEIYVAKRIRIEPGENWISLMMVPDVNTIARVFGTNQLPAGLTLADSTRVEWYAPANDAVATNVVWLSSDGVWMFAGGGVADDYPLPLREAFNVVIPSGASTDGLLVVGKVPTNAAPQYGHSVSIAPSGVYNVVSYNVPHAIRLIDSGLKEAGLRGPPEGQAVNPNNSDELRILQRGGGTMAAPAKRILMNGSGQFVFWTGGSGIADNYRLSPDEALIIYTRMSKSNLTWNVELPYTSPPAEFQP